MAATTNRKGITMSAKIISLTPEQEAMLTAARDEWIGHGLSTEPADRAAAEAGVRAAYERAGLDAPEVFIWVDSPLAGCVAAAALRDQVGDQVGRQVWGQVGRQVGRQVGDQVWRQVGRQVRDQVGGQVGDQVWDQVWGQVWLQVRDQVWGQVWDQVGGQVGGQVSRAVYGQHDPGWMAWYDAMTRIGVTGIDADGLAQVAKNAGWWWPFENTVVISDRPDTLHRDPQGRLHCEMGPALRYRDGWAIYALHGALVPTDLIETGWDTERVLSERNAEVRRAAIELTGWDQFVDAAGLTLVASAPDPGNPPHELFLYDLPDRLASVYDDSARILLCTNGTPEADGTRRRYGLPVPAHHTDPVAAAADLVGWPVEAYRRAQVRR